MDHRVLALPCPVTVTITAVLFRSYEIRPADSFPLDIFRLVINELRKSMVKFKRKIYTIFTDFY